MSSNTFQFKEIEFISSSEKLFKGFSSLEGTILIDTDENEFNKDCILQLKNEAGVRLIVLCAEENEALLQLCVRSEIPGILTKTCDLQEIQDCLLATQKGHRFFCKKVLYSLLEDSNQTNNCDSTFLTDRELEVLQLIAEGHSNKSAGVVLRISRHTVHTHRKNLMKKLGANTLAELLKEAYRLQLIEQR